MLGHIILQFNISAITTAVLTRTVVPCCWQTIFNISGLSVRSGVGGTANSLPHVETGGSCSTNKSLEAPDTDVRLFPAEKER